MRHIDKVKRAVVLFIEVLMVNMKFWVKVFPKKEPDNGAVEPCVAFNQRVSTVRGIGYVVAAFSLNTPSSVRQEARKNNGKVAN